MFRHSPEFSGRTPHFPNTTLSPNGCTARPPRMASPLLQPGPPLLPPPGGPTAPQIVSAHSPGPPSRTPPAHLPQPATWVCALPATHNHSLHCSRDTPGYFSHREAGSVPGACVWSSGACQLAHSPPCARPFSKPINPRASERRLNLKVSGATLMPNPVEMRSQRLTTSALPAVLRAYHE